VESSARTQNSHAKVPVETNVPACYRDLRVVDNWRQLGSSTRDAFVLEMGVLIYGSAIRVRRNTRACKHLQISNRLFIDQESQSRKPDFGHFRLPETRRESKTTA
jgi:hypothetical protein